MGAAFITAFAAVALLLAAPAAARTVHYGARLDGASETPPKAIAGSGAADLSLDTKTKTIKWTVRYSGLTGPATMAHFHGPAAVGKAAGVQVGLAGDLASPAKGSATLNDSQIGDLKAGLWYINVHTAQNPGGEIRGQVLPAR